MIELHIVDQEGTEHVIEGQAEENIVDMAEDNGIILPYACKAGACRVCACTVVEGEDKMIQNLTGTKMMHIGREQFLTCIGGLKERFVDDNEKHVVKVIMGSNY